RNTPMKKLMSGSALLLLATVLGIATAAASFAWLSRADTEPEQVAQSFERTRPAVVAVADIPAGTRITADMVAVKDIPDAAFLQGTLTDAPAVVGRVTRYPLLTGEQVNINKVVTDGQPSGSGLAFSVPPGMRAVS